MFSQKKVIVQNQLLVDSSTTQQELLTVVLKNRQIKKEDLKEFLEPSDPFILNAVSFGVSVPEVSKAVARIRLAIENKENILIYGDYDVDGITSTAILWQVLNKAGAKVTPFVPDREADGYGFKYDSYKRFSEIKNIKFNLLITVDNGIVAGRQMQKIKDKGVDIIITDHHLSDPNNIPPAFAVIHSTQVSGSILSWFLASKISKNADLGLAALGGVADCIPLLGVNRNIIVHGLKKIKESPSVGLQKLMEISNVKQETISTYDLGFLIGPRINAVGRLSNPTDALRLLCSQTPELATRYAQGLDAFNKDRQILQKDSVDMADKFHDTKNKIIFAFNPDFHPGIIGLIAGRLTEKYYLPSIIISQGDEISKGSCRSIKELNIIETLRIFEDLFVELGGHSGAAGFSIKNENIPILQEKITLYINDKFSKITLEPNIIVDAQMTLSAVNLKNYNALEKLAPFGFENQKPLFYFKNITITQKRVVGQTGDHLKLKFDDLNTKTIENISTDAIAFKKGDLDPHLNIGSIVDIVAEVDSNTWNNVTTPQLMVKEIFKIK